MDFGQFYIILVSVLGGLLVIALGVLFFVSRRSQKVMQSVLEIMTRPERARVQDAVRVLNSILADEIIKLESSFQVIRDELNGQIAVAKELNQQLAEQNNRLVETADDATKKIAVMAQRLDNTVGDLTGVVQSGGWQDIGVITERFSTTVNELLAKIDTTSQETTERVATIQNNIDQWILAGDTLNQKLTSDFDSSVEQMKNLNTECESMQQKLESLSTSVADGFENVKTSAQNYEDVMDNTNKALDEHLVKMDTFWH